MRVGFVGVGRLGGHLATSLVNAGFDVVVHDRDDEAVRRLVAAGAETAGSPAEVARAAATVITCLPAPAVVARVVAAGDGVLTPLRHGATWIDLSTNDRNELLRLAALAWPGRVG